jgi:hypothetical protein
MTVAKSGVDDLRVDREHSDLNIHDPTKSITDRLIVIGPASRATTTR